MALGASQRYRYAPRSSTGLTQDDLHLDDELPFVQVRDHAHRRLKTEASNRVIPLVGTCLWAAKRIADHRGVFFPALH